MSLTLQTGGWAQRGEATCSTSHSKEVIGVEMDPRLSVSKANDLTLDNLISQMRELRFREKPSD